METTGPIEAFMPVFLFAIVFGLSMDYEVFLVTRMHEEWEHGKEAAAAVRNGLALTGKVVMAAAIIMISVFGSFMLGDDRTIKLFGLGLASAVLFDAFIIRLILVPSLMYMFGKWSWWMPEGLVRRLPRLSIEGPETPATESAAVAPVRGAHYKGHLGATDQANVAVTFTVSKDGKSVRDMNVGPRPPDTCGGGGPPPHQASSTVPIRNGTFTAHVTYRSSTGSVISKVTVTGRFLDHGKERGVVDATPTHDPRCGGSFKYATTAH